MFGRRKNVIDRLDYDLIRKMVETANASPNLEVRITTLAGEQIVIRTKDDAGKSRLRTALKKYE